MIYLLKKLNKEANKMEIIRCSNSEKFIATELYKQIRLIAKDKVKSMDFHFIESAFNNEKYDSLFSYANKCFPTLKISKLKAVRYRDLECEKNILKVIYNHKKK